MLEDLKLKMEELVGTLRESLDEYGITFGKNPDQLLSKSAIICNKYGLNADDFAGSWMAFAATNSVSELDEERLQEFEKQELSTRKESEKPMESAAMESWNSCTTVRENVAVYSKSYPMEDEENTEIDIGCEPTDSVDYFNLYGNVTDTPKSEKKPLLRLRNHNVGDTPKSDFSPAGYSPAVDAKSVSYGARTKAGDVILRYKCKDSTYWDDVPDSDLPVKIKATQCTEHFLNSQTSIKYMFQNNSDIAAILNALNAEAEPHFPDIENVDLADLRLSSGTPSWYLGRIRSDEGRLSQKSTYLEGDVDVSGGHVIALDLSIAEEYRLFPGQVVIIKGQNELGQCLRVSEIAIPKPLPAPQIIASPSRPLNIIVACGPFTPIDSLQYEPLKDLIQVVKRDRPDICIFIGPFIDPSHPLIVDGEVAFTFDDMFQTMIDHIKSTLKDLKTHIVLVSSSKDAHHDQVYPTPPYPVKEGDKITSLPDPAIIEVEGITIGLTSTDILKHLANSEISQSTITDRMGGLSKLILSQKNFYPLYPSDETLPIDTQLWSKYCKFKETPHILIVPSDLRYFVKEVEEIIIVNSERLTKGKSGGTYARLQVKLPEPFRENVTSVADFCFGEILKI